MMRFSCIFVAFALLFPVSAHGEIVARHTLAKGAILELGDIREEKLSPEERDLFLKDYRGKSLTRMIYANQNIPISYICQPAIIKRNNMVRMVYQYGSLQIQTQGRALDEGAKGGIISVMNMSSRQIVQGEIIGPDLVRLF